MGAGSVRPVLTATDPLPHRPRRLLVAGTSGSGKTTLAGRISDLLGITRVEIDALYHGPGWVAREDFVPTVLAFSGQQEWVTEWQYDEVRALLAERADTLIWLDFSRAQVMRQVLVRTVRRRLTRQKLWNSNVEEPLRTIFTDPEHIVRWAWSTHHKTEGRIRQAMQNHPTLTVIRLRSHAETARWLAGPLSAARPNPEH
jgi:adenylate kinase family enzyme